MDKGIRPFVVAKFAELNAKRIAGEFTNTAFRKTVMACLMEEFDCTLASASTHYNYAFKEVKKNDVAAVEGLGRADDKKGGRKAKAKQEVEPSVRDTVLGNMLVAFTPPKQEAKQEVAAVEATAVLFTVVNAKTQGVVATGLTEEQADTLIAKAASQKKAKLQKI